jgi:acid phosphatase family membrane protein YuiD
MSAFWENPIVLSCFWSWFLAQFVKAFIALLRVRKRGVRDIFVSLFWKTGGMPSSHAALVSSMTASVGFRSGAGSDLFAVSFFMALIVMRDALGVRRSSGLQARSLNSFGRAAGEKLGIDFHPVKEVQGHTPMEVLVGTLLGIFIAGAVFFL